MRRSHKELTFVAELAAQRLRLEDRLSLDELTLMYREATGRGLRDSLDTVTWAAEHIIRVLHDMGLTVYRVTEEGFDAQVASPNDPLIHRYVPGLGGNAATHALRVARRQDDPFWLASQNRYVTSANGAAQRFNIGKRIASLLGRDDDHPDDQIGPGAHG